MAEFRVLLAATGPEYPHCRSPGSSRTPGKLPKASSSLFGKHQDPYPTEINHSSYMPQYPQGPYLEVDAFLICFDVSEAVPNHLMPKNDARCQNGRRGCSTGKVVQRHGKPRGAFGTIPSSALPSPTDWPVPMV